MPLEFSLFESTCNQSGYTKVVDQKNGIYAMWTRNGVKVEIKRQKTKGDMYVAGQGLSKEKLTLLKEEFTQQGMILIKENAKHFCLKLQEDILGGFFILVNTIEDIDGIEQRKAYARSGVEFKPNETFIFIAETLQNSIKRGQPWAISRGFGGFDVIDNKITVGYSIKGREQERNGKNAYREHIVPCDLIMREGKRMFDEGATVDQVASMFEKNTFILKISDEEADLLDNKLKLKTTMPEGWNFGDSVYCRITFADIQLETRA
jgi:hypothetical protein